MTSPQTPPATAAAALLGACPRCAKAPLFRSPVNLALRERCSACGLDYAFIDTGDGPAIFAIFILGFLVLGGALWLEFTFDPPVWVHVVVWGLLTPLVALLLLRLLKGTLVALQYRNKAEQGRLQDR